MARVLRVKNKVFYTIGSSGHEGNAMVARLTRHTDPAFLHYRSGAFMAERSRKLPGIDPVRDSALSFAASKADPASGGRHKVWGSKPLWVLPQTSTIASHLPKAFGTAMAIDQAVRLGHDLPIPDDSIAICSFGDASTNHATAQTRLQRRGLGRLPEAARAGAVRVRGQRHRHLGEDPGRLDRQQFPAPLQPGLFLCRRPGPGARLRRRGARRRALPAHATADLPAPATPAA